MKYRRVVSEARAIAARCGMHGKYFARGIVDPGECGVPR